MGDLRHATVRLGNRTSAARPEIRLDGALELHGHGITMAIDGFAGDDAHPAFADAILFDIVALDAVEADANATFEQFLVEERALRVVAQAVRRRVAHGSFGVGMNGDRQFCLTIQILAISEKSAKPTGRNKGVGREAIFQQ